jgi:hypothetical protein
MKVVKLAFIVVLLSIVLLTAPTVMAQDDEEEDASGDACIFSSFCIVMLFIFFLIYVSSRKKSGDYQQTRGTGPPGYPPTPPDTRYPMPRSYPPHRMRGQSPPPPPKTEIKCDLCNSKNLRVFEGGYYKCNDCRHVFYHTEYSRRRR